MDLPLDLDQSKFTEALSQKKASAVCVSCGSNDWTLVPQAALVPQWINALPSPGIPVGVAICNNCGFVRLHALSALGLLPEEATKLERTNEQV